MGRGVWLMLLGRGFDIQKRGSVRRYDEQALTKDFIFLENADSNHILSMYFDQCRAF
jgi:hypothetical protein